MLSYFHQFSKEPGYLVNSTIVRENTLIRGNSLKIIPNVKLILFEQAQSSLWLYNMVY